MPLDPKSSKFTSLMPVLYWFTVLATYIHHLKCSVINQSHISFSHSNHPQISISNSSEDVITTQQHQHNNTEGESLAIEFIEYIILGIIVFLLVILLLALRYIRTLKHKCPRWCCSWFPDPEITEKQEPIDKIFQTEHSYPMAYYGNDNDDGEIDDTRTSQTSKEIECDKL